MHEENTSREGQGHREKVEKNERKKEWIKERVHIASCSWQTEDIINSQWDSVCCLLTLCPNCKRCEQALLTKTAWLLYLQLEWPDWTYWEVVLHATMRCNILTELLSLNVFLFSFKFVAQTILIYISFLIAFELTVAGPCHHVFTSVYPSSACVCVCARSLCVWVCESNYSCFSLSFWTAQKNMFDKLVSSKMYRGGCRGHSPYSSHLS